MFVGMAFRASLVAQTVGKASACNAGRPGFDSWVGKIPWRRKWQSTPAFLPGKSHGRRSLIGYSSWGHKESDTTERIHFHFHQLKKSATTLVQVPDIHSRLTESKLLETGTKKICTHIKFEGKKAECLDKGQSLTFNN